MPSKKVLSRTSVEELDAELGDSSWESRVSPRFHPSTGTLHLVILLFCLISQTVIVFKVSDLYFDILGSDNLLQV
ncbi:hypothetical protein RND71_042357 [Anisodus tanguticus]|uniref:Uncharacterized protein n=1 Tax=Anisodus tanguticus TaxID=243964 RepID=A0AAE1UUJ9_9SOLA|nr:hypothetical protein RND71_042357 [Anisodus tanguticus]